jgi:hypothetical protein
VTWRVLTMLGAPQAHRDDATGNTRARPHGPQTDDCALEAESIQGVGDAARVQAGQTRHKVNGHGLTQGSSRASHR